MLRLFKRRVLARAHRPPLQPHERVLAWAMTTGEAAVVATNLGLWWGGTRTPWHEISKAVWDPDVLTVTTSTVVEEREGYSVIADKPPVRLPLVDPGYLPHQVRLRVTSSVRHPQRFEVGWVAARRVPGKDGLFWVVRYDPGVVPGDHAAEADAAFEEMYWKNVGGSE